MRKLSFLVIAFLLSSSHVVYALKIQSKVNPDTRPVTVYNKHFVQNGASFILKSAEIILTGVDASTPVPVLILGYDISNQNETRKMSLEMPFTFVLEDEFKNIYRSLDKPVEYEGPVSAQEPHFPSLYPGQNFSEMVFFEAPIAESRTLFLTVSNETLGMDQFVVKLPVKKISGLQEWRAIEDGPVQEEEAAVPVPIGPIEIVAPINGATVAPGESVHIAIRVPDDTVKPDRVYVVVPTYILEDRQLAFEYDLKIPEDGTGLFAITVIGKWDTQQGEEVLSDSIVLNIGVPASVN